MPGRKQPSPRRALALSDAALAKLAEGLVAEEARRATELAMVIDFAGETGRAQALVYRLAAR